VVKPVSKKVKVEIPKAKPSKAVAPVVNKTSNTKKTASKPVHSGNLKPLNNKKPVKQLAPVVSKTPVFVETQAVAPIVESKRYSDVELAEFKEIINRKLGPVREEYNNLMGQMQNPGLNGADTDNAYNKIDDGSSTSEKEFLSQSAARLRKFIENLENALIRIENKTYGICRETGKLISKERLRAVPHTTLSMEAKLKQYK
jgi:RNA polymerase-binding protein DksA